MALISAPSVSAISHCVSQREMSRQTARLEEVHAQLGEHRGTMGMRLVADVLAFGTTIESAAVARRRGDKQALRGFVFQAVLAPSLRRARPRDRDRVEARRWGAAPPELGIKVRRSAATPSRPPGSPPTSKLAARSKRPGHGRA
jgi:hypothetical protein